MNKSNEPAFPCEYNVSDDYEITEIQSGPRSYKALGLTIREEFAKAAMQGLLAHHGEDAQFLEVVAVTRADALLAELAKEVK